MSVVRVSYHAKDRLPLILGPLKRSYEALREAYPDSAVFLRSGWLKGPHLDLCVLTESDGPNLGPHVAAVQAWIEENPSNAKLDPDGYAALSAQLGALEGVPGPYGPLRGDNSVEQNIYRAPRLVDQHEALQAEYVRFFNRATPTIFALAELKRGRKTAFTLGLAMMLARAAGQLKPEGLARGYISLQAHADFFFANFDRAQQFRAHFEGLDRTWGKAVDAIVGGGDYSGFVTADEHAALVALEALWNGALLATEEALRRACRDDRSWFYYDPTGFNDNRLEEHESSFAKAGINGAIARGETLDDMWSEIDTEFFSSENFQVFRVILNMFYSILPTISVSPAERFCLCYLVARSVRRAAS